MNIDSNDKNNEKCCAACLLGMPQADYDGATVCAGKYYGRILTEEELDTFVCDEFEPYPDFFLNKYLL